MPMDKWVPAANRFASHGNHGLGALMSLKTNYFPLAIVILLLSFFLHFCSSFFSFFVSFFFLLLETTMTRWRITKEWSRCIHDCFWTIKSVSFKINKSRPIESVLGLFFVLLSHFSFLFSFFSSLLYTIMKSYLLILSTN